MKQCSQQKYVAVHSTQHNEEAVLIVQSNNRGSPQHAIHRAVLWYKVAISTVHSSILQIRYEAEVLMAQIM